MKTMTYCLLALSILLLNACSSLGINEQTADANTESSEVSPSHSFEGHSSAHDLNGKPLWIWIAPAYRVDLPKGTREYLIENI